MDDLLLAGAYDLHVHPAPDVPPRSQNVYELARDAAAVGMAGVGLKSHVFPTVMVAEALRQAFPDGPAFYGSITLNAQVGGLNPLAVKATLEAGGRIVWFPTFSAAHHRKVWGTSPNYPLPAEAPEGLTIFAGKDQLKPEVRDILALIAKHDAILATGHLSNRECRQLLEAARAAGVTRRVLTHVNEEVSRMPMEEQRLLAAEGVFIEYSFMGATPACPGTLPLEQMAGEIRALGPEHVLLTSDFGQVPNGPIVPGFAAWLEKLKAVGISRDALRVMIADNPRKLVAS